MKGTTSSGQKHFRKYCPVSFLILLLWGCSPTPLLQFKVTEPVGIDRDLEYIEVVWEMNQLPKEKSFSISSKDYSVQGQVLSIDSSMGNIYKIKALFPIRIAAHKTVSYKLYHQPAAMLDSLKIIDDQHGPIIHNSYFSADLTANESNDNELLYAGQLKTISLSNPNVPLFKRKNINIHWAPNVQAIGRPYRTLGHLDNKHSKKHIGPYQIKIEKEGHIDEYPEIKFKSQYTFLAGLPYLIFSSEILVQKDIELTLLRNDEMTLDSLFTHVYYKEGELTKKLDLYDTSTFDLLDKNPIPDNAPWVAFVNVKKKYHYGSIRLSYNNKNLQGGTSPLFEPHTKITAVWDGGRYWNRRLIHDHNTMIPSGSRYLERNVYFVGSTTDSLQIEVDRLQKKLENPVQITIK